MNDTENSVSSQFLEKNEIDIEDEMPVPKEEIVDIKADDSDLDIIEVHCNINPNRINNVKKFVNNRIRRKLKNVDLEGKSKSNLDVKEEIIISDSSDTEYDSSVRQQLKSKRTRKNKDDSLTSITLNCPKCNKTSTVFTTTLTSECKECKVNMSFVCTECNNKYQSLLALFRHKKLQCKRYLSALIQFVHKCTKCQVKYKMNNLSRPRNCLKCKLPMGFECIICSQEHFSHAVIYKHVRNQCQLSSRVLFCNDCQFKCTSQRALLLHLGSCHQNLYMLNTNCDKCGKVFANHFTLKQHKTVCGVQYYYCRICPYRPRLKHNLSRHLQVLHKIPKDEIEKMLDDSMCPKTFTKTIVDKPVDKTRKRVTDPAIKVLTETTCKECNHTQPVMSRQTKCHKCKKDLVFQCLYCPMRFRMPSLLQRHARRMHGKVEYVCNVCTKPFSFFGDYNDHRKWCGKEPRFKCHLCLFKTKYRHNLKGHLENLHSGNRPLFVCQDCGMGYKTEKSMNRHYELGCNGNAGAATQ